MEKLDLVDLEAGARVAGHGFYFLKNAGRPFSMQPFVQSRLGEAAI